MTSSVYKNIFRIVFLAGILVVSGCENDSVTENGFLVKVRFPLARFVRWKPTLLLRDAFQRLKRTKLIRFMFAHPMVPKRLLLSAPNWMVHSKQNWFPVITLSYLTKNRLKSEAAICHRRLL